MYAPTPDGKVNILRGVPVDPEYKHTLYWTSAASQASYFAGLTKNQYDHMMYIRETGRLRAPCCSDDIDDCNYLMYKNEQYVDKWFYAFIKHVYYVNDNACEIEFEIDVLQTYLFDIDIRQSYIERQHTVTDHIGENVIPENLDIGHYQIQSQGRAWGSNGVTLWDVIAFATFDWTTWQLTSGSNIYGTYSALTRTVLGQIQVTSDFSATTSYSWTTDARSKINDLLQNHSDLIDGVIAIVMAPHELEAGYTWFDVTKPAEGDGLVGLNPYTPINNKLWTAPYTVLYVTDTNGSGKMFAFEQFNGASARFYCYTDKAPNQTVLVTPRAYRNYATHANMNIPNFEESVLVTGFPQCAWSSDSYKQYLAQNQANIGISYGLGLAQIVGGAALTVFSEGAAAPMGVGLMASGAQTVVNQLADLNDRSKQPPKAHGNVSGTAYMSVGEKVPRYIKLCVNNKMAPIIDSFFTKFGYAIHAVGTPNIAARPHWTYIKTVDACILPVAGGGLPSAALAKIINIFDRGVTFWKNPAEVGDYTLDNRPA